MEWLKEHKRLIMDIGLFLLLFIITMVISLILVDTWGDQVWSYGFSYNISKGMIIYKDFNAVQTPLYFMIGSLFIKIFGNYMISTCILDSLVIAAMGLLMYKTIGIKFIFPLFITLFYCPSPYNLLCMMLLVIILYLIDKNKYNDYLVALIVGLILITKQNLGVLLFIPMFFYSKHKIKSICIFLIPFSLLCIYFLFNHSLFNFIDYTILGLINFTQNLYYESFFLFIEIVCFIYLFYKLIKSKFKDKEAFYILLFQLIAYPLYDARHVSAALVLFLYYFFKNCKNNMVKIFIGVVAINWMCAVFITSDYHPHINTKKDLLFLRNLDISKYINRIKEDYNGDIKNLYFDSEYSYLVKLYYGIPISKYDLMVDGNLGFHNKDNTYKDLEKHCKKEKCTFYIYSGVADDSQWIEFRKFITNHYKKTGEFDIMDIYSSK